MYLGYSDSGERMARLGSESVPCFSKPSSSSPLAKSGTSSSLQASSLSPGNTSQEFENYDLVATNELSARTLSNSDGSLGELRTRLLQLQGQVVCLQNENRRLSILSNGGYSSLTLDEESDNDDGPDICLGQRIDKLNESERSHFDLCRWIRGSGGTATSEPKLRVLHRRHISSSSGRLAKPLPLRLSRPAAVSELLGKHSNYAQSIGKFMSRYATMTPFKPYTLEGAHDMPAMPGIALINDLATQYLPPLAGEEYAGHISRISYLMRALHSIELADPEFLSNPRVNMFVDLVLDLEQSLTLPRIDFLRRHSETIQAMSIHAQRRLQTKTDTEYVVGDADTLCWGPQPDASEMALVCARPEKTPADLRHIGYMARAIPRHPDFCSSNRREGKVNATTNDRSPSHSATSEPILGNRLRPSGAFYLENPCTAVNNLANATVSKTEPSAANVAVNRFCITDAQSLGARALRQYQVMTPDSAIAAGFDPKLCPVVGPRSMDVAPTLQVSNNCSIPLLLYAQASSRYSQRLRHQAPPRTQTLGAFSDYQTKDI